VRSVRVLEGCRSRWDGLHSPCTWIVAFTAGKVTLRPSTQSLLVLVGWRGWQRFTGTVSRRSDDGLQRERRADYGQRPSSRPRNAPATRRAEIGHSDHPRLTTTLPLLRCPSIQSPSTSTFCGPCSAKQSTTVLNHYLIIEFIFCLRSRCAPLVVVLPVPELAAVQICAYTSPTLRGVGYRCQGSQGKLHFCPSSDRNKGLTLLSKHLLFYLFKFFKHIHTRPCDLRVQRLVFCDSFDVRYLCYLLVSTPSPSALPTHLCSRTACLALPTVLFCFFDRAPA
jgi:hypothetical protein